MNKRNITKDHLALDPVCGMQVDTLENKLNYKHAGHTYYFCSPGCQTKLPLAKFPSPSSGSGASAIWS